MTEKVVSLRGEKVRIPDGAPESVDGVGMTAEVISLIERYPIVPPDEPVSGVIEYLEEALEKARAGRLRGLAVVAFEEGSFVTDWAYDGSLRVSQGVAAGIIALTWRYGRAMCQDDFVEPPDSGEPA